ncbi:MAG: hypothetical protein IME97_01310, partial [Proteobacteria bacterium]|nr:hypothetical protein [Pseudomonadota bacterium]
MLIRRLYIGSIVLFLTLAVFCIPASYSNPLPSVPDEFNGMFFRNSEVFIDTDDSGTVSIGDIFWGVINCNEIVAPTNKQGQTGPEIWPLIGVSPAKITGYFATVVVATYEEGHQSNPFPVDVIVMGPAVDPNGVLASGEVLRIFEGTNFNFNDSKQGSALSTATDGALLWSFGMGPGGGSPGGYWYALAPLVIPDAGPVGEAYAGLNVIIAPPGDAFGLVNDPNEDFSTAPILGGLDVQFWFNSELFRLPENADLEIGPDQHMHFGSNDPAVYKPVEEELPGQCRMTGGNVTVLPVLDAYGDETWTYKFNSLIKDKDNRITTGGQINTPSGNHPPSGHWTHTSHGDLKFTFHSGTSSAPEGTEISTIECADSGWCVQARCAPFKQIFWTGIGNFTS